MRYASLLVVCLLTIALTAQVLAQEEKEFPLLMQRTKMTAGKVAEKYANAEFLKPRDREVVAMMPASVEIIKDYTSSHLPPKEYVAAIKNNYQMLSALSEKPFEKESVQAVVGLALDYKAKADGILKSATSMTNPFAKIKVTVRTLKGTNPAPGFRVVCAPENQLDDKTTHVKFKKLSDPTTEGSLMQGSYWFWTETDEDPPKKGKESLFAVSDNGKGECDPIDLPIP
jgi:hypothetical protein